MHDTNTRDHALILHRYGTGTLTKVFVDRVFQECLTYDGEVVGVLTTRFLMSGLNKLSSD